MQTDPREMLWALVPRLPKCRVCKEPATLMGQSGARCAEHGREVGVFNYALSYAKPLAPIVDFLREESIALATSEGRAVRKALAEVTPELVADSFEHSMGIVEAFNASPELHDLIEHVAQLLSRYASGYNLNDHRNGLLRKAALLVGVVALLDMGAIPNPDESETVPPPDGERDGSEQKGEVEA